MSKCDDINGSRKRVMSDCHMFIKDLQATRTSLMARGPKPCMLFAPHRLMCFTSRMVVHIAIVLQTVSFMVKSPTGPREGDLKDKTV